MRSRRRRRHLRWWPFVLALALLLVAMPVIAAGITDAQALALLGATLQQQVSALTTTVTNMTDAMVKMACIQYAGKPTC